MERFTVLVVDDEEILRDSLRAALTASTPHEYLFAGDGVEAMEIIHARPVNLVLTDLQMPRMNGRDLLQAVKKHNPEIPVIVITAFGAIDDAVDLLRQGAYDYITKPFKVTELVNRLERALERLRLMDEITALKQRLVHGAAVERIIGRSPPIMEILRKLPAIARSDASVVIFGESGTGKELVARAVHALSPRTDRPFVPVDCGALPESLLENELFGHLKGAFTDAHANHVGLIQEADTGTLFLDEIGEIGLPVQVKLLRFLQEREFRPLGSTRNLKVDVRIISATNKDLRKAIGAGTFREDLYYRLNIIPLTLPPLRERKEDIPVLANHFLSRSAAEFGREGMKLSPLAMQRLSSYDWPGNIRELENKVQQLVALAETDVILPSHVEFDTLVPDAYIDDIRTFKEAKAEVVRRFEVRYIERLLALNGGNVTRAARQAGKHRRAFWELMKKHGISSERHQRVG